MDEERFQQICTEITTILEINYPDDLNQRLAVTGFMHAAMMVAMLKMYGKNEGELWEEEIVYLSDLLTIMKANNSIKTTVTGVH